MMGERLRQELLRRADRADRAAVVSGSGIRRWRLLGRADGLRTAASLITVPSTCLTCAAGSGNVGESPGAAGQEHKETP